jgi:hypothetical protein
MKRWSRFVFAAAAAAAASTAWAEKYVQATVENRTIFAFKVNAASLQRWVPAPWQVTPVASGPAKDANVNLQFIDRLLDQDGEGKAVSTPTYRNVVLTTAGMNPQTKEAGPLVLRIYSTSADAVPGFYKTAVPATVDREQTITASGTALGSVLDRWSMKDGKGGSIDMLLQYQRGTPVRTKVEAKPRSGMDPAIWRIYRIDMSTDVLRSVHGATDRVQKFELRIKVPELAPLFDGSEQLIAVTSIPHYTRQAFLPNL